MICTANYVARQYGVRSAMPGFIARKLCPKLVFISPHFDLYTEGKKDSPVIFLLEVVLSHTHLPFTCFTVAKETRAIFAEYDPQFRAGSLDEVC